MPGVIHKVHPTTPDGRYFVVKGQLWRCSDPSLSEDVRQQWVDELMAARRNVKAAKASENAEALKAARAEVDKAKVALGERGNVWWTDGAADFNRRNVENTPYAQWFKDLDSLQP